MYLGVVWGMKSNITVLMQHLAILINPADKQDEINMGMVWNK